MKHIIRKRHLRVAWWHTLPNEWRITTGNRTAWCTLGKLTVDFGRMP